MPGDGSGCHGVQRSYCWQISLVMVASSMECNGVLLMTGDRSDGSGCHGV